MRKAFYAYANNHGLLAAIEWLAGQSGFSDAQVQSRKMLEAELESL